MSPAPPHSRREFLGALGGAAVLGLAPAAASHQQGELEAFLLRREEIRLRFRFPPGERRLSFGRWEGKPEDWRAACRGKLRELLGLPEWKPAAVKEVRDLRHGGIRIRALVADLGSDLTLPAYLLEPPRPRPGRAVMAIHGHGQVEPLLGLQDDYHHAFALELARAGHRVLAPALRGFGLLRDLAAGDPGRCLDYWDWDRGHQFTLATDAFQHGRTLLGDTIADLLRWEDWLARTQGVQKVDVAGISYGGDLAITFPAFSERTDRIFASGSHGSFEAIFGRCYNAPAHCIPGVLQWLDRSDIAGLSAPRLQLHHYGELDRPGPDNNSASWNETVGPALAETRRIYEAFGAAPERVGLHVSPGRVHEMDVPVLLQFLETGPD